MQQIKRIKAKQAAWVVQTQKARTAQRHTNLKPQSNHALGRGHPAQLCGAAVRRHLPAGTAHPTCVAMRIDYLQSPVHPTHTRTYSDKQTHTQTHSHINNRSSSRPPFLRNTSRQRCRRRHHHRHHHQHHNTFACTTKDALIIERDLPRLLRPICPSLGGRLFCEPLKKLLVS